MDNIDPRFIQILGEDMMHIAKQWEQLSAEDLLEIKNEYEFKQVFCVYDNWRDFTEYYIESDRSHLNVPEYLFHCIDIEKATQYLSTMLKDEYTVLSSGKVIQGE